MIRGLPFTFRDYRTKTNINHWKSLYYFSKYVVEKVAIWQHFLISDKHRAYPPFFDICVLSFSNKKLHYNRVGQQFFFLMHLLRGWDLLCRKENTIKLAFSAKFCENFILATIPEEKAWLLLSKKEKYVYNASD